MPTLWVDADACPLSTRGILNKAARRTGIDLVYIANHMIPVPADRNITSVQVSSGFDVADDEIVNRAQPGDLVITADIPLAAEVMQKGAQALSARGEAYDADTIGQRLNLRDFMDTMRGSNAKGQNGPIGGGPPPMGPKEKQAFANHLDRWLRTVAGPAKS
jgi:uncharacterized protein YaiI (UPF0178 family)